MTSCPSNKLQKPTATTTVVALLSSGMLLDSKVVHLLKQRETICISTLKNTPTWITCRTYCKPHTKKGILHYLLNTRSLLRELAQQEPIILHTPHFDHLESNIIKNNFPSRILITPEGNLDVYDKYKMTSKMRALAFAKRLIARALGYTYEIYTDDIRAGMKPSYQRELQKSDTLICGNNAMILGKLFVDRHEVDSEELVRRYEKLLTRLGTKKAYYKPHPHETLHKWPGIFDIEIITDTEPAETLIEKYGISHLIGTHSSTLINCQKMYSDLESISTSLDLIIQGGILTPDNAESLRQAFRANGVTILDK